MIVVVCKSDTYDDDDDNSNWRTRQIGLDVSVARWSPSAGYVAFRRRRRRRHHHSRRDPKRRPVFRSPHPAATTRVTDGQTYFLHPRFSVTYYYYYLIIFTRRSALVAAREVTGRKTTFVFISIGFDFYFFPPHNGKKSRFVRQGRRRPPDGRSPSLHAHAHLIVWSLRPSRCSRSNDDIPFGHPSRCVIVVSPTPRDVFS